MLNDEEFAEAQKADEKRRTRMRPWEESFVECLKGMALPMPSSLSRLGKKSLNC